MTRKVSSLVAPEGSLEVLSQQEIERLRDTSSSGLYELLRRCSLAVLNSGTPTDDGRQVLETYHDFAIEVIQEDRGLRLKLDNAPADAFVDGQMIRGIREHLSAVLRDIVYVANEIKFHNRFDLENSESITNAVFHVLRNASVLCPGNTPNLVVCWGGHSISREEYDYSKSVGYQLGLRHMDICTGCGPGAMKGPMKGAHVAHAKQRERHGRYLGISEPGIIAAEAPNPIVNQLVIMPDIEKRLEAFVRMAHGIIVFPGGVGTTEEILYLLGILMHPDNRDIPMPVVFTGPADSAAYFEQVDAFLCDILGPQVRQYYQIIIDDAQAVALAMQRGLASLTTFRKANNDAFYFNWRLTIPYAFQQPFIPNHTNMAALNLTPEQPIHDLAAQLRCAFSGIVAGNVKEQGIKAIEEHGRFVLSAPDNVKTAMDGLLQAFVSQQRMKLPGTEYVPCYQLA